MASSSASSASQAPGSNDPLLRVETLRHIASRSVRPTHRLSLSTAVVGLWLTALASSCSQMTTITKSTELPVALEARAVITPAFDEHALTAAGESGLFAELVGRITDVVVRSAPDEWTLEVVAVDPHEVLAGPPLAAVEAPGAAEEARSRPGEGSQPVPEPPARWTITVGGVTGLVAPFDEGDAVWVRRSSWLDPGTPTPKESVSMGRVGDGVSLVFFDGSPAADWGMLVPSAVRLRASSALVYTTTGKDERSCHRVIEHRAFAIPAEPSAVLRPGESLSVTREGVRWTVVAIDQAATMESETCPERRWDRFAWLAVRSVGVVPPPAEPPSEGDP
jgi:hypothetical protein